MTKNKPIYHAWDTLSILYVYKSLHFKSVYFWPRVGYILFICLKGIEKKVVAFLYYLSLLPFELLYVVTGYRRCCPATKGMQIIVILDTENMHQPAVCEVFKQSSACSEYMV